MPLSTIFVVDFPGSAGLLGLCAAVLDRVVFTLVLVLIIFCAVGFLSTTMWSIAESLVYRQHKGSKWLQDVLSARWERTRALLPFRVAIKIGHGIFSLAISVWHGVVDIMDWLYESVGRFLHHNRSRGTPIPMALNNSWKILGAWALGSSMADSGRGLEAVHGNERGAVDHQAVEVTQVEETGEDAAYFWKRPHNAESVLLNVIKTHAHLGAIR